MGWKEWGFNSNPGFGQVGTTKKTKTTSGGFQSFHPPQKMAGKNQKSGCIENQISTISTPDILMAFHELGPNQLPEKPPVLLVN